VLVLAVPGAQAALVELRALVALRVPVVLPGGDDACGNEASDKTKMAMQH
jgi:D-aminopeptidase